MGCAGSQAFLVVLNAGCTVPSLHCLQYCLLCHTGGPVFNEVGECVGIAFQSLAGSDAENIGYVIPTPVIQHFLTDFR